MYKKTCTALFIAALFIIAKRNERCLSIKERIIKM